MLRKIGNRHCRSRVAFGPRRLPPRLAASKWRTGDRGGRSFVR